MPNLSKLSPLPSYYDLKILKMTVLAFDIDLSNDNGFLLLYKYKSDFYEVWQPWLPNFIKNLTYTF